MKRFILPLLFCLSLKAQTNPIVIGVGYNLLAGQHAANTTSNVEELISLQDNYGYRFNTNDTTYVAWDFPGNIVFGTNLYVSMFCVATNTNNINFQSIVSFFDATNGLLYRDTNNVSTALTLGGTNFYTVTYTDRLSAGLYHLQTNIAYSHTNVYPVFTNIVYGTVKFTHVPTNIMSGGYIRLIGGRIVFRNY